MEIPKFNLFDHYRHLSDLLHAQYSVSSSYNHRGSKGILREYLLTEILRSISNDYVHLTKGEICDSMGRRSPEFDIIISHQSSAIRLFSSPFQNVLPVETVLGIIEVKTKLSADAVGTFNEALKVVNAFDRFFVTTAIYKQLGKITGNNEFESFDGNPLKPTDHILGVGRILGGIFAYESNSIDAVQSFLNDITPEPNFGFICVLDQFIALPIPGQTGWTYSMLGRDTFSGFATIFNDLISSISEREQHIKPDSFRYIQFAADSVPVNQSG